MATLFPREEKAEGLFDEILKDPSACRRLMHAFYDALNYEEDLGIDELPPQKFAKALFNAYENKDLTAFLMAVCQHSMFDLLRSAFLVPFRFNADGEPNPVLLTDDEDKLLPDTDYRVYPHDYERFHEAFAKRDKVKMYLASGYRKCHGYDADTMDIQEYHIDRHLGILLVYELPDTIKQKETEAQAYVAVCGIMMKMQDKLPQAIVYYGQDSLQENGKRYDELGVFLPLEHFSGSMEKHIKIADSIVYSEEEK